MFYKALVTIILFNCLVFNRVHTSNYFGLFGSKTLEKSSSEDCQVLMANTFCEMVLSEEPYLSTAAQETVSRLSAFIFEKMVPGSIEKIVFNKNDPAQFTLHFTHSHVGNIQKIEKGAEAGFKAITFKVKEKLNGYFSPEDAAIYLEKDAYSGKHSFFKTQYSLNKVKFHINGDDPSDIILETDLGAATKEWQENEMIATFKHMKWKKG